MSFLSPQTWPFSLDWLPPSAYLVGGAVRDALLNRKRDYWDLDFILPSDAVEIASKIAKYYQAGFVILDEQRQIARIVFKQATVDFALQEGDSLEVDLARRDFTINAIAYNPHQQKFIDPQQGLLDLEHKQLKMISVANLQSDPLRLLRAYRQAAQLDFTIEATTQESIRHLALLLGRVAAERVQSELNYLLANSRGSYWLQKAWEDGLLSIWLPAVTAFQIEQLTKIDKIIPGLSSQWCQINWQTEVLPQAKLACLVKPEPAEAKLELMKLKYSRATINAITAVLNNLPLTAESLREQYFLFLNTGKHFPILATVALARGTDKELIIALLNRYFNRTDPIAHPQPLVKGNDLTNALPMVKGPQIGQLLTEIQIAYIEGKISTPQEAIKFAKNHLKLLSL